MTIRHDLGIDLDPSLGSAVAHGFMIAATTAIEELVAIKGDGDWLPILREAAKWRAFNLGIPGDVSPEVADQWADAVHEAIDAVFGNVAAGKVEDPRG